MPRTRDVVLLLLGATLGLLAARFNEYLHHDGHIATVAFAENRITAYNASGVVIWQRGMPATINHAALATGDDSTQQYVAVACESQDPWHTNLNVDTSGKLIMLAADGSDMWNYGVEDEPCVFNNSAITYRGLRPVKIVTIHHHGTPALAVLFEHYHFACSFLVELRVSDGKELGSYWNHGLGGYISRISDFGRTKEYLLWWNVPNNSLQTSQPELYGHGPFRYKQYPLNAILFDPDNIHGASPCTIEDGCTITGTPGYGSELWYATYRWTDSMLGPEIQARAYDDPVRRSVVIEIKTNQQLYQVALDGSHANGVHVVRPRYRSAADAPPPSAPQPPTRGTVDTALTHQRNGVRHRNKGHPPRI